MLLLAKLEIENKKSKDSALLRIKSYPKEFIKKLIKNKQIRYDDIALSEIKKWISIKENLLLKIIY